MILPSALFLSETICVGPDRIAELPSSPSCMVFKFFHKLFEYVVVYTQMKAHNLFPIGCYLTMAWEKSHELG